MKKLFRGALCAGLLALALSIPAFAAEEPPARQGDFYVLVNGQYVTFPDAVPQIKDSRSCLPFVAVFEQLGFAEEDMTWDDATKSVAAVKDGLEIKLTIGLPQIQLTMQDGQVTGIATDVAPYIDPATSRTYVPFGLVADALGYHVGWDAEQKAVIIDDVDAILAANTETYTLMEGYMAYGQSFQEGNQQVTGSFSMGIGTLSQAGGIETAERMSLAGEYEMLTAGSTAFQMAADLDLDMELLENGVDVTQDSLGWAVQLPLNLDLELRGDMESGALYYQSAVLNLLMGQPGDPQAWYKLDFKALYDQMGASGGMDYTSLLRLSAASGGQSFAQTLETMLRAFPLTSVELTTADYLQLLNAMLGDSAFEKSGSSYVNTLEQDGTTMTFLLNTSGSQVTGYSMDMATYDPATGTELAMLATMEGKELAVMMSLTMPAASDGSHAQVALELGMDGTYQSTSRAPATQPPAGAEIFNFNQGLPS